RADAAPGRLPRRALRACSPARLPGALPRVAERHLNPRGDGARREVAAESGAMRSWLFVLCLLPSLSFAAEGMWTFDALPTAAIESSLGVKLTPEWVTRVQHGAA